MKHLLLAGALLLAGCSSPTTEKPAARVEVDGKAVMPAPNLPAYQVITIAQSENLLLSTASYTGVILRNEKPARWAYGLTVRALTPAEVLQAETILQRCVSPEQVTWYWYKSGIDSLDGVVQRWTAPRHSQPILPDPQAELLHPLQAYRRQYQGLRTPEGQRVVWINALPVEKGDTQLNSVLQPSWLRTVVHVEDGGADYFNVYVNLDSKRCLNFFRNSIGG